MAKRKRCCEFCGEDLGEIEAWPGDMPTCGKPECERYAQDSEREDRDNRMFDAIDDDFGRY